MQLNSRSENLCQQLFQKALEILAANSKKQVKVDATKQARAKSKNSPAQVMLQQTLSPTPSQLFSLSFAALRAARLRLISAAVYLWDAVQVSGTNL